MNGKAFEVDVGGAPTSAVLYAAGAARAAVVLAHGAGGRQRHPWIVAMARALAARDFDVVTFDFLYAHAGRRPPDRNEVLEATWRAVIAKVRSRADVAHGRLYLAGKSMGGRIATQVVAGGTAGDVAGVVLFGYPLHPPGRPERLRAADLPAITAPMLFVQGSRDTFGGPDELRPILAPIPNARLFVVEGGDHSLTPPKRGGATLATVIDRVAAEVAAFALTA